MKRDIHHDARLLGGEVSARQIRCPGPGHRCNDRSLSLKPSAKSPVGYIFHSFAGDDQIDCLDMIRAKLGLPQFSPGEYVPPPVVTEPENDASDDEKLERAKQIWREAGEIRGSLGEIYLRDSRGLRLDSDLGWHRILRFHKGANAIVALFRDILTDDPRAIHRIFLTKPITRTKGRQLSSGKWSPSRYSPGGLKINRKMIGKVAGCAIKLDRLTGDTLAIGEGIETCLAGRVAGYRPAWAVGSANAIKAFPVIDGVERLYIFGENDKSGASAKAIAECRERWAAAGRKVFAVFPPSQFSDLNDAHIAEVLAPATVRQRIFLATCKKFWLGAEIASSPHTGESVQALLAKIGYRAFGVH
jgi:putative DNA primase/helicase